MREPTSSSREPALHKPERPITHIFVVSPPYPPPPLTNSLSTCTKQQQKGPVFTFLENMPSSSPDKPDAEADASSRFPGTILRLRRLAPSSGAPLALLSPSCDSLIGTFSYPSMALLGGATVSEAFAVSISNSPAACAAGLFVSLSTSPSEGGIVGIPSLNRVSTASLHLPFLRCFSWS